MIDLKHFNRRCSLVLGGLLFLLLIVPTDAPAQYKGDVVKRDRLIQVLRSKRFQSRDIVQIIKESGVDFKSTQAIENELVAAGARPPVLDAVRTNYRGGESSGRGKNNAASTIGKSGGAPLNTYNALVDQAVDAYDIKKDRQAANEFLQRAVILQSANPRAYQFLGFLNLYGNRNFDEAERYWKDAIRLGGSAVLRVTHDHNGMFLSSCQGSLYIAKNTVRFEADNNDHTFETSDRNIKKIEVNSRFKRLVQLKGGSFKIVLEREDDTAKFSFAPLSGKTDESKMIIRLIGK